MKVLAPAELESRQIGSATVVNTTASQRAQSVGIAAPALPVPAVPPRTFWPAGIYGTALGYPNAQLPPRPVEWLSEADGTPTVGFKAKAIAPAGMDAPSPGYPVARERAQRVLHQSPDEAAIFGDVLLWLRGTSIAPQGWDALAVSAWTDVRTLRRWLALPAGIDASAFGEGALRNQTPSIFPVGIACAQWGLPDASWRVRSAALGGIAPPLPQLSPPALWQTPGIPPGRCLTAWPSVRAALIQGWSAQQMGGPDIGFSWRSVPLAGMAGDAYGAVRIEYAVRSLGHLGGKRHAGSR